MSGVEKCRVCGGDVPEGSPRCPHCSAAHGVQVACPHCRGIGGTSPDPELRFRCDLCGGPRVPRAKGFSPSGSEVGHLKLADKARRARAGWRAAAIASGLLLPLIGGVLFLLVLLFGLGVGLFFTGVFTLTPVVALLALAVTRARARGAEIAPALDAAWVAVASDVARQNAGSISAPELAQKLGIDEAQAEELVALLDVNAVVAPVPMRFESAPKPAPPSMDAAAETEVAAELEAEAAARARAGAAKS